MLIRPHGGKTKLLVDKFAASVLLHRVAIEGVAYKASLVVSVELVASLGGCGLTSAESSIRANNESRGALVASPVGGSPNAVSDITDVGRGNRSTSTLVFGWEETSSAGQAEALSSPDHAPDASEDVDDLALTVLGEAVAWSAEVAVDWGANLLFVDEAEAVGWEEGPAFRALDGSLVAEGAAVGECVPLEAALDGG